MKLVSIPKKKKSLRAIDQGSVYDVAGKMLRLQRSIMRGDEGDVRDMVIIFTVEEGGGRKSLGTYHFGTGSAANAHWMLSTAKNRIEPA